MYGSMLMPKYKVDSHLKPIPSNLLYDPQFEKDGCGTGFVADIKGRKSHAILEQGIESVVNLTHRGAIGADAKTGDGAGILTQIPRKLFDPIISELGKAVPSEGDLAVGVFFFSDRKENEQAEEVIIEKVVSNYKLDVLGWRDVPVDSSILGESALRTLPAIKQLLIGRTDDVAKDLFEQMLYLVRREIEHELRNQNLDNFYIPSFSSQTIVYKGLLVAPQLKDFFLDLANPDYETAIALFHQRYSTNTFPDWNLAQPFRLIGHNGEINTLQSNRSWIRAREGALASDVFKENIDKLKPILEPDASDSASLDNAFEALVMSGKDILHSVTMLIPEAWRDDAEMHPEWKSYYEYHVCSMEPWDGPAALTFTDGTIVGATLDRNGLRPARYIVTKDDVVIMGSEVGMVAIDESKIAFKERLGPGKIMAIDTAKGKLLLDEEIKNQVSSQQPYGDWVKQQMTRLDDLDVKPLPAEKKKTAEELLKQQLAFGYTSEEIDMVLRPMAETAKDAVGSMGDDTPLAVLSQKTRLLYTYFKQLFAQVTNPAIDPIREELVMSTISYLGQRRNLFSETPEHAQLIELSSPCLLREELETIRENLTGKFEAATVSCSFDPAKGPSALEQGVQAMVQEAEKAIDAGAKVVILSHADGSDKKAHIPMLLAVGACHHHLIRVGKRMSAGIIAETYDARELHHFATLIGFGANAVCPTLAFDTLDSLIETNKVKEVSSEKAAHNFRNAVNKGLLKILSKMGISTITSYCGGQIFEAIGLDEKLIETCFTGTASKVGGLTYEDLARDVLTWHENAYGLETEAKLDIGGFYRYRGGGEYHAFNPNVIKSIHKYVRSGEKADYDEYAAHVNNRPKTALRDILNIKSLGKAIPLEEVEPISKISKRYNTPGMSLGALSPETHETLAVAMNRIGAKSDSGEGGEDKKRYKPYANGDWANSKIKQVASGRFGVTIEYLSSAEELEIKVAQGSKPGEGGQLPGHKVTAEIAKLRNATPGVTLISPPPHHDIYSIEDLAQLIYDLKQANPKARITVKLVAVSGVGTIAAGVAKAHADNILISGHDGGTGASPLSSIKNAGGPWELGIAEVQQVLVLNDLRGRIRLRADGGMKTGRDVVVAALLGAEEYGFGTMALIAAGCCMIRQCHLNTCPVGVATQDEKLRAKYVGTAEMVVNFFNGISGEVREILASIGAKSLDEIIGRTDLLESAIPADHIKAKELDLSRLLAEADSEGTRDRKQTQERNDWHNDHPLDLDLIPQAKESLENQKPVQIKSDVRNIHRSVGTQLSHEVAKRYGDTGLEPGTITIDLKGTAGQSFGAFAVRGLRLKLHGEANDYVGKGMCGGEIIVNPHEEATFATHENVIIGNTVMYGATSGALYAAGKAGERFCVRNSGANAVVEGAGDHCCEYMTGGTVVVLGETGRNFGAGMTGGQAFILDEVKLFEKRYNPQLIRINRVTDETDKIALKSLIEAHLTFTGSPHAKKILDNWEEYLPHFWKVYPHPTETKIKSELAMNVNKIRRGEKPQVWVDPVGDKK